MNLLDGRVFLLDLFLKEGFAFIYARLQVFQISKIADGIGNLEKSRLSRLEEKCY